MIQKELQGQLDEVKKVDPTFAGEFMDLGNETFVVTLGYFPSEINPADVAKLKGILAP